MTARSHLLRAITIALLLGIFFAAGFATRSLLRLEAARPEPTSSLPLILSPLVILPILHALQH